MSLHLEINASFFYAALMNYQQQRNREAVQYEAL